jgi:hypothetical protein
MKRTISSSSDVEVKATEAPLSIPDVYRQDTADIPVDQLLLAENSLKLNFRRYW